MKARCPVQSAALKVLIGTCTDDGDITYKETGVDFQIP
ncbi:hypothetical protein DGo_PB0377 (plasmid) [Deinococcus gobiensis I-0]|uniref:Uncharacterized protein n=1 Tax=Deinococcus gobiensis (strain DSM 21396 / JCM 16679 / CGMCC 1.7299 / I-0) TaxID=745776 RepID=H8H299_DEIGI|nr:hypothetical protein DGo_PB0377 [Deinococcus gobiensis I-0]